MLDQNTELLMMANMKMLRRQYGNGTRTNKHYLQPWRETMAILSMPCVSTNVNKVVVGDGILGP